MDVSVAFMKSETKTDDAANVAAYKQYPYAHQSVQRTCFIRGWNACKEILKPTL